VKLCTLISCLCLLTFLAEAKGQTTRPLIITPETEQMMKNAYDQGQIICDAMIKKDFATMADYTLPAALELAGGKEKMVAALGAAITKMESTGFHIVSTKVDRPSELVDTSKTVYAILPESLKMDVPNGHGTKDSYLLGVSEDRGATWKFLDGAGGSAAIKKMLPDLPMSLVLPAQSKLVVAKPDQSQTQDAGFMPPANPQQAGAPDFESAAEKWVAQFKGMTEEQVQEKLGTVCERSEWKGGEYGGLELNYKVGKTGSVKLLFLKTKVIVADFTVATRD
jgi:hypothetical protein